MYKRQAHTLKGIAGNIGALEIQKAAAKLEAACSENSDADQIKSCLQAVESALQPVLNKLKTLPDLQQSRITVSETFDPDAVAPLIQSLQQLLQEDDTEAVTVLEQIEQKLGHNPKTEEKIKQLRRKIDQYDFEGSIQLLLELAETLSINIIT